MSEYVYATSVAVWVVVAVLVVAVIWCRAQVEFDKDFGCKRALMLSWAPVVS